MQASIKLLLTLMLFAFSVNAFGQCDPKTGEGCEPSSDFSGLPIDLLPPGARSLGLAGAFAGVADDATAAIANPAGLTILTAKEFSLHFRNSDSDIDFLDPDAFDSSVFSEPGRLNKKYSDSTSNVSFASFVMPFDRWVFSAYYMTQLDFESSQDGGSDVVRDNQFYDTYYNDNSIETTLDGFGISGAFRVTDSFSIGLTVQQSSLDIKSLDRWQVDNFQDLEIQFADVFPEIPIGDFEAAILDEAVVQSSIDSDDSDTTFSLGMLYSPSSNWSFGLVYREGAEFSVTSLQEGSGILDCVGSGAATEKCIEVFDALEISRPTTDSSSNQKATKIKVPDTLTLGVAWRPTDTLLVSFDINNIGYADTTPVRDFTQGFGVDINGGASVLTEKIDDETTFHVGVEKVFVLESNNTFTVRGGAFTVEDHDGIASIDSGDTVITVGVGTTFGSQGQFQMDLGASFADNSDNIILSGIYRF
jgi:long-subunit fatty acid transport protein